jgi:energy-coupling factor transporter ATP-binding protein EcfA2
LLTVKNIGVSFSSRPGVLDNVDFSLPHGKILLLAGATGSGKSTLLQRLCNVIPQQVKATAHGEVFLDGEEISKISLNLLSREVQIVWQNAEAGLFSLDVRGDIAFGLENLNLPLSEISARVDEAAEAMGIAELLRRDPARLSGGEQQKAAIAAAIAMKPKLLLLDEPFTNLDEEGAAKFLSLLQELRQGGMTIIVAEHRFEKILRIADQALILHEGRQLYCGRASGASNLLENIKALNVDENCEIVKSDAVQFAKFASGKKFDLILADPPFFQYSIYEVVKYVFENDLLADDGYFIIERSIQTLKKDIEGFGKEPFKRIGDTCLYEFTQ